MRFMFMRVRLRQGRLVCFGNGDKRMVMLAARAVLMRCGAAGGKGDGVMGVAAGGAMGVIAAMVMAAADGNTFAKKFLRPVANIWIDKIGNGAGQRVIDGVGNVFSALLFGFIGFKCTG